MNKVLAHFKVTKTVEYHVNILSETPESALQALTEAQGQHGLLVGYIVPTEVRIEEEGYTPWEAK